MLYKIREFCPRSTLRSLFFSIFNSHLSYGLPVWGNADHILINKLINLQKKAIKAISFADFNAHTSPLFKKQEILTLTDQYQQNLASLLWDLDHEKLPHSLLNLFCKRNDAYNHSTRMSTSGKYSVKKFNTKRYGQKSFQVEGSLTLNRLKSLDIYKNSSSKTAFLNKYKKSFLEFY